MLPRTGTMQSSKLPSGALLCALLLLSTAAAQLLDEESEEELSPRALRDFYPKGPNLTSEKQLVSFGCAPQTRRNRNFLFSCKCSTEVLYPPPPDCVFWSRLCFSPLTKTSAVGPNGNCVCVLPLVLLQLGALQEVLEKLQAKRLPSWEKKFGQVPMCDVGEQCAVRKGARIGKMCDCPRGAFCNFFLLKCL
uniref:Cocaine- and amphetamine-regulated transcript protein n=1 Tax=Oryzias latipes TaxID=8090 RepID=A0A3P9K447_ORYLA